MAIQFPKPSYMQNREFSWLRFNERVLEEALDESVPLLERLKFVSVFSSNLDKFFMLRVGGLFDALSLKEESYDAKTNLTVREQLDLIYRTTNSLYAKREEVLELVESKLREQGICCLRPWELDETDKTHIESYFNLHMEPVLSPQIIDSYQPFPHFANKLVNVCAMLRYQEKDVFGTVTIPENMASVVYLPGETLRYIRTEDVVRMHLDRLFSGCTIKESTCLCLTRNADILTDEQVVDIDVDFRNTMRQLLAQNKKMAPVRLELSHKVSAELEQYLCEKIGVSAEQIFISDTPMNMPYAFSIESKLPLELRTALTDEKFTPCVSAALIPNESIMRQVMQKDILLSHPFESMEPFLQLVREASCDPAVTSIKITIYRLGPKPRLVEYLCAAAENGKAVTVIMELRARFDEQNNIDWSEQLEKAGCKIIYGIEGYKIHAKICLITRESKKGISYITQIGTGNYNEETVLNYTDVSLMTAHHEIGLDAVEFFKNMEQGNLNGSYKHFLVAPVSLKKSLLELIQQEMDKGRQGKIYFKVNDLTDIDIIQKLSQASCAGVRISLLVRSICCILPGVMGYTDNVHVSNIVGRFLEHSRIFCFGQGSDEKMYISSADLMTRNTERRVEIACPIYSPDVRQKIHHIIYVSQIDNVKGRTMDCFGVYHKKAHSVPSTNSQYVLMSAAQANRPPKPKKGFIHKLRSLFEK